MVSRAGIVVTGTEVLTGRVADRNGPWLAEQLRLHGVDIAQVVIVGDRRDDLRDALHFLTRVGRNDLVVTSGGLGPTADDLTAEVVGEVQGRPLELDARLRQDIAAIVARLAGARGWQLDPVATDAAVGKQAMVPRGAAVLAPTGTAPGLVVPAGAGRSGPPVVVLPGPPSELQDMWPAVLDDPLVRQALSGRGEVRQRTLRLWGTAESELAATLRSLDGRLTELEITTCLSGGELEIVTRYPATGERAYRALEARIASTYPHTLFSTDGRGVEQIVADALVERGLTIATAESCTAGLLAGRLTERAGSSAYVVGGLVTYANRAKTALAGVAPELIADLGAVSAEVARAMAHGARERVGTDIGIGITGIAGPGGGSVDKPVGLVHLHAVGPDGELPRRIVVPGTREHVRRRSVAEALHMVRELLHL